jgi:hypothetical protein
VLKLICKTNTRMEINFTQKIVDLNDI